MLVGKMRVSPDNDRHVMGLQPDALITAGVDGRQWPTCLLADARSILCHSASAGTRSVSIVASSRLLWKPRTTV
jgi:hypothetical protein